MRVKPIKTDLDHEAALKEVERLWGSAEGTRDGDRLDVLVTLVEAYERRRYPIDLPDPIQAIRFRLEQQGKNLNALVGVIGTRNRVLEVMNGKRALSLSMIRALNKHLGISANILIQPSRRKPHAACHLNVVNRLLR